MNFDDLSDDEMEQLEQQYQDLDPKLIQIQTLIELQRIRVTLEHMATPDSNDTSDDTVCNYECNRCGDIVAEGEREDHAANAHNWMPEVSSIKDEFEQV